MKTDMSRLSNETHAQLLLGADWAHHRKTIEFSWETDEALESSLTTQIRMGRIELADYLFSRRVSDIVSSVCTCDWSRQNVKHIILQCLNPAKERSSILCDDEWQVVAWEKVIPMIIKLKALNDGMYLNDLRSYLERPKPSTYSIPTGYCPAASSLDGNGMNDAI